MSEREEVVLIFEIEIPPMTMTDTRTIIRHISVSEFFTLLLFMDIKLPFL